MIVYIEYRNEMQRQRKKMCQLADYLGLKPSNLSKKFCGKSPLRMNEAYGAMDFIGKPISEIEKYFPRKVVEAC